MRSLAALTAVLICAVAQAQMPMTKKYPWDQRPNKCFMPGAEGGAECKSNDWPNFGETQRRVSRLLVEPDLELIERAAHEVGFSRERFESGEYRVEAWDAAFRSFFDAWADDARELASAWTKAKGTQGYAPYVQALAARSEAWKARGSGYSNTVTREAWEIYRKKLAEADAFLETASPQLRQAAPWHMTKLRIAFERGEGPPPIAGLKRATEQWPDYLPLYTMSMYFLSPKWGGSFEQMEAVARYASEATRERSKPAMYVLVWERNLRVNPDATYTLRDTRVDWDLMKQGFRELENSAAWMPRRFAELACQMRDRDETRRLYAIADRQSSAPASGADPCRAFAMQQ